MEIGAILLHPFDMAHLSALQASIVATLRDPAQPMDPTKIEVAYATHPELPGCIVVHLRRTDEHDGPSRFFAHQDEPDGIGPAISGYLADQLGDAVPTTTAYTCLYDRRVGAFTVYTGFYFTAEAVDEEASPAPLDRLAQQLDVADVALLRNKLEQPDTDWTPLLGR